MPWIFLIYTIITFDIIYINNTVKEVRSMARLNLPNFPDGLHVKLKIQAAKERTTMTEIIIRLVTEYLERVGG